MAVRILGSVMVLCVAICALTALRTGPVGPTSPCEDTCYQAKSMAYQRCRAIPPGDREARVRCFRQADDELRRCLQSCR